MADTKSDNQSTGGQAEGTADESRMTPSGQGRHRGRSFPAPESIDALLRMCRNINNFKQQDQLLHTTARLIPKVVSASGGSVLLWDPRKEVFSLKAVWFDNPDHKARFKSMVPPLDGVTGGRVFETGTPSIVNNSAGCPDMARRTGSPSSNWIQNRMDVPLKIHGRTIGLLSAINKTEADFHQADLDLLASIAGIVALAMENIRIRESLAGYYRQIKDFNRAKDSVIHHLSHALKTPLSVGMASLKLLRKHLKRLPETDWQDIYERIQRNLTRLLTIEYEMEDILRQRQEEDRVIDSLSMASEDASPSGRDGSKKGAGQSDQNGYGGKK